MQPPLSSERTGIAFVCFDALHIDGRDLTSAPYVERRRQLDQRRLKYTHSMTTPSPQHEAASDVTATATVA